MPFPTDLVKFTPSEFSRPDLMNHDLLYRLDAFAKYIGLSVIISSSNSDSETHTPKSQHYLGKAVDIVVPQWKGSLFSLYLIAERFGFTGIGIYPDWTYRDKIVGGMHLDYREVIKYQGKRWIGISSMVDDKKVNKYYPVNMKNLVDLKIINVKG